MSDLIDRQVAIDKLQKEINKGTQPFDDVMGAIRCGVRLARNIIEDLPSAQPQRKSGQLLYHHTENIDEVKTVDVYFCSSCKKEVLKKIRFGMFTGALDIHYGYCPHCGAIYGGDAK